MLAPVCRAGCMLARVRMRGNIIGIAWSSAIAVEAYKGRRSWAKYGSLQHMTVSDVAGHASSGAGWGVASPAAGISTPTAWRKSHDAVIAFVEIPSGTISCNASVLPAGSFPKDITLAAETGTDSTRRKTDSGN